MTTAKGLYGRIIYVPEVTWGITPNTPTCHKIQFASEGLVGEKSTITSNLLRNDRNIEYMIYGNKNAGGSINTELLYGMYDPFIEAALFGTWTGNVLKNGITERFFTLEKGLTDIAQYIPYTGMMVSTMKIDIAPNKITTLELTFSGKNESTPASTSIDPDAEYATGTGSEPFDTYSGSLKEGGVVSSLITAINFTVDNGFSDGYAIGSASKAGIFAGRCNVSGTFSMYVQDFSVYSKFVNGTESSIQLTITDIDGKDYIFLFPRIKFGGETPKITGEGPIIQNVPFLALYDNTEACTLKITRSLV